LGAVPPETIQDLEKIFDRKVTKVLAKKLSYQALLGSAVIYHQTQPGTFGDPRHCPHIKPQSTEMLQMPVSPSVMDGIETQSGRSDQTDSPQMQPQSDSLPGHPEAQQGTTDDNTNLESAAPATDQALPLDPEPMPLDPIDIIHPLSRSASDDVLDKLDSLSASGDALRNPDQLESTPQNHEDLLMKINQILDHSKKLRDRASKKMHQSKRPHDKRRKTMQERDEEQIQKIYLNHLKEQSEGGEGLSGEAYTDPPTAA